jgi:flavodoxin
MTRAESSSDFDRRSLLAAMAGWPLVGSAENAGSLEPRRGSSRVLVTYFTRSGNTRVVAGLLQRALGADLFEIKPATAYPEDYLQTVEQASAEKKRGHMRPLAAPLKALAFYDTVFLGFPIWAETAPAIIRTLLSTHDFSGKALVPFITHGGYGLGDSLEVLARQAKRARLKPGFSMQSDQERQTMNTVLGWLKEAQPVTNAD